MSTDTIIEVDIKKLEKHIKSIHKKHKAVKKGDEYYSDVKDAYEPSREELQNIQDKKPDIEQVIKTFLPNYDRSLQTIYLTC